MVVHAPQYLLLSVFLIMAIPVGVQWYLTVVFICIFPDMTHYVEHFHLYTFLNIHPTLIKTTYF